MKHTSPKTHQTDANNPSYKPQKKVGSSKQYRRLHRRSQNLNSSDFGFRPSDVEPSDVIPEKSDAKQMSHVTPQQLPNSNSWNMRLYSISHS